MTKIDDGGTAVEKIKYEDLTPRMGNKAKFWGEQHSERYSWTDIDEAIEHILDAMYPTPLRDIPDTIEVSGVAPIEISISQIESAICLESVFDTLDEEYADPESPESECTPLIKAGVRMLAEAIKRDYDVFMCEEVIRVEVQTHKWIRENREHWQPCGQATTDEEGVNP